jgi:branched-subunit amino acid aminotransferase/4-amino-4-deoxychorismate lyase
VDDRTSARMAGQQKRSGGRRRATREAVWLNGRIVDASRALLPITERGFLYGDGLFETVRAYGGRPFLLARHVARLRSGARMLAIPAPGATSYWARAVGRILAANGIADAAVRLTVTRGTAAGLDPPDHPRPTVLVQARGLDPALPAAQTSGINVCLLPFARGSGPFVGLKTLGYLPAVLARRDARRRKAYDGLYVTDDGDVTEATTANFFAWQDNRLRTPGQGILRGITRDLVATLARRVGLRVEEGPIHRTALRGAQEMFLTSSVVEILPVVRVDDRKIGTGAPGPITRLLQEAYRRQVARGTT